MSTATKIFLFLAFTASVVACGRKEGSGGPVTERIRLKTLTGEQIDLAHYKGKTLFINFWATWCRPCVEEMPSIDRAKNQLQRDDIEFFFASDEEVESIRKFKEKRGLDLHYVIAENMEELKIEALPTTMIISPKGELVFSEIGFRKWDDPANLELISKIMNDK